MAPTKRKEPESTTKQSSSKKRATNRIVISKTCAHWMPDKERTCLKAIAPASKEFCSIHMDEKVKYVSMELSPIELRTATLLREYDLTEQIHKQITDMAAEIHGNIAYLTAYPHRHHTGEQLDADFKAEVKKVVENFFRRPRYR